MTSKTIEQIVIESMEPTFAEILDTNWAVRYSDGLGFTQVLIGKSSDGVVFTLNDWMRHSVGAKYDAYVDVASTLESLCPEKYAGKFVY